MRTDDLIVMLSNNVEPVERGKLARIFGAALAIGAVAAIGLVVLALGLRPDFSETEAFVSLLLKVFFTAGLVAIAAVYLVKHARPGGERKTSLAPLGLPFVALIAFAALVLGWTPHAHWNGLLLGDQWLECLLSIPVIAVVPFAVMIWAVRQAMPTDLRRAGALAGLVAGALSATGYALHCVDDSVPFIALWYGGTIALCTLAGWALGPRLLRW